MAAYTDRKDNDHSSKKSFPDSGCTKIEITGLDDDLTSDDLKTYFETARSGGRKGSVLSCIVEEGGKAYVEFDSSEVAAAVVSKQSHDIAGDAFTAQYPSEDHVDPFCSILISQLPPRVDMEFLKGKLEPQFGTVSYSIERSDDNSCILNISDNLSNTELEGMVKKLKEIQIKRKNIEARVLPVHTVSKSTVPEFCTLNGKPTRFCNARLLVSKLPTDGCSPSYAEVLIENLIKCTFKDISFMIENQGDTILIKFRDCISVSDLNEIASSISQTKPKNCTTCMHCVLNDATSTLPVEILVTGFASRTDEYIALTLEEAIEMIHGTDFNFIQHGDKSILIHLMKIPDKKELDRILEGIKNVKNKEQYLKVELHQTISEMDSTNLKLLVSNLPPNYDVDHLALVVEKITKMDNITDFDLVMQEKSSAIVTFKKKLSKQECQYIVSSVNECQMKGNHLNAIQYHESPSKPLLSLAQPSQILISNIPENTSTLLKMRLEDDMGKEHDNDFTLEPQEEGTALLTIKWNPSEKDLQDMIARINGHLLKGNTLKAERYASKVPAVSEECPMMLIKWISCCEEQILVLALEAATKLDSTEFCVNMLSDCSATVTFQKPLTQQELYDLRNKIEGKNIKKGEMLQVEIFQQPSTIHIWNITEHYDEEHLRYYFESAKRSGGGKIKSLQLLGNGQAIIAFQDQSVMKCVLQQSHVKMLGNDVLLEKEMPGNMTKTNKPVCQYCPITMPLSPQVVAVMKNDLGPIKNILSEFNVTVQMTENGMLLSPSQSTKDSWENVCRDRISMYINENILEVSLKISEKGLALLLPTLLHITKTEKCFSYSSVPGPNCSVCHFTGKHSIIQQIKDDVEKINMSITVTTQQIDIDDRKFDFISQVKQMNIRMANPKVEILYQAPHSITAQGILQDIKQLEAHIATIHYISIPFEIHDRHLIEFLHSDIGKTQLKILLGDLGHTSVVAYAAMNNLSLLCEPELELTIKSVANTIKNDLCCKQADLGVHFVHFLAQSGQKEFDDLCKKHSRVMIKTVNKEVLIVGFKQPVGECYDTLTAFIENKCTIRKTIEMELGIWRLFQGPLIAKWKKLEDTKKVKIICPEDNAHALSEKPVVTLEGEIDAVQFINDQIIKLKESVVVKEIAESQPGLKEYLRETIVHTMIHGIESEHKVCIELNNKSTATISKSMLRLHSHREVLIAYTKEHKKVCVCIGDITEFTRADVLVNAANKELKHNGGVAKAFLEKGGFIIQEASDKHLRKHHKLNDGNVWLTEDIGALPCKALIHAIGPKFTKGAKFDDDKRQLHKAYYSAMKEANLKGYHSIAFPAISAGVYECPYEVTAEKWIEAVTSFSKSGQAQALNEIYFIATDEETAKLVTAVIKSKSEDLVELSSSSTTDIGMPSPAVKQSHLPNLEHLKFLKQSLLDVKADVYVNTTNVQLNITSGGAISTMLAKAAGPQLQQECSQKAPIAQGDVAVTGAGGSLQCQKIFHIALPNYSKGGYAEKVLYMSMQKCFNECSRLKLTSIAFPALGTGNLKYPPLVTAEIMIKATIEYMTSNPSPTTSVYFTIYNDDHLCSIFEDELRKFQSLATIGQATPVEPNSISASVANISGTYMIQNITISIVKGDITDERSDVIVNSANSDLQLEKTVIGRALLKKAGPTLQQQCNAIISKSNELMRGAVACTSACGSLKCKAVFHVDISGSHSIAKSVHACLNEAEGKQYDSISFPALGTGAHHCTPNDAATYILEGIKLFTTSRKSQLLNTIRIVVFMPEMYQIFLDVFNTPKSLWNRITGAIYNNVSSLWSNDGNTKTTRTKPESHIERRADDMLATTVHIKIYGEIDHMVEAAESKMYEIIRKTFEPRTIENPIIGKLSSDEMEQLRKFSGDNNVSINFDFAINEITLEGEVTNVAKVYAFVQTTLANYDKQGLIMEQAESMLNVIEWQHQNPDGSFTPYDALQNYYIEKEFGLNPKGEYQCTSKDGFKIDFSARMQFDVNGKSTKVQRLNKSTQDCPPEWDTMPIDKASNREVCYHLVQIQPGSTEYITVITAFSKTMVQRVNTQVLQIQRIQNPTLYHQYTSKRTDMNKQNQPGHQNERKLFHGTAADACDKINAQGLNRNFAGKNATAYGRGVYFARDAFYSAQDIYSPPDAKGNKHMYLVGVLTGEYTLGTSSTIVPLAKDSKKDVNVLFDSTVDNIQNPSIFVTYNDAQAYPEYLITFK